MGSSISKKWRFVESSLEAVSGNAVSEETVINAIITPIKEKPQDLDVLQPWSSGTGYSIEAKNFMIGQGVTQGDSNKWTPTGGIIWNAGSQVKSVTFTDIGQPGDEGNTVNAAIELNSFTPTVDLDIFLDFDENPDHPIKKINSKEIIDVNLKWNYNAKQTATVAPASGLTQATVNAGSSTQKTEVKISGSLTVNAQSNFTKVAEINFESESDHFYDLEVGNNQLFQLSTAKNISANSLFKADVISKTKLNKLTSTFKIGVFVKHGVLSKLQQKNINEIGILGNISTPIIARSLTQVSKIDNVKVGFSDVTPDGGAKVIKVYGTKGAKYNLFFEKKVATTSSVTASTGGYFNFSTKKFQTDRSSLKGTIGSSGFNSHSINFPSTSTETRYDLTIDGSVDGQSTTLGSNVPKSAGDATIIQHGRNTLTIKPITYNSSRYASLSGLDVTIVKPDRFEKDGYVDPKTRTIQLSGSTNGTDTRLVLDGRRDIDSIIPGMIVTGEGVTAGSTVTGVKQGVVVLSASSTVPANSVLSFTSDSSVYKAFSITIQPNSNTLNVTAGISESEHFGGLSKIKDSTAGVTTGTSVVIASTKGIVPGMTISGDTIKEKITVASVTNATTLVLSKALTLKSALRLQFSNKNTESSASIFDIKATKVGSNIVITGLVDVTNIGESAESRIYIDDLITAS